MFLIVSEATTYISTGATIFGVIVAIVTIIYNQGKKHQATQAKLDAHNQEMKTLNESTKRDVEGRIDQVHAQMKQQITEVRADMNKGLGDVGKDLVALRGEVNLVRETSKQAFDEGGKRMDRHSSSLTELRDKTGKMEVQVGQIRAKLEPS